MMLDDEVCGGKHPERSPASGPSPISSMACMMPENRFCRGVVGSQHVRRGQRFTTGGPRAGRARGRQDTPRPTQPRLPSPRRWTLRAPGSRAVPTHHYEERCIRHLASHLLTSLSPALDSTRPRLSGLCSSSLHARQAGAGRVGACEARRGECAAQVHAHCPKAWRTSGTHVCSGQSAELGKGWRASRERAR